MAKIVFTFNGAEIKIHCTKEDKMKDICNRFATKIETNLNSLLFIYNGNKINYKLTFKQQANSIDNENNQMNLLVYLNENNGIKCKKCGEVLNLDIIDNIKKYNNELKETLIEMNNQIDNIINSNNINDIKRKIKVIKLMLNNLTTENDKFFSKIQDIISNDEISQSNNQSRINTNNTGMYNYINMNSMNNNMHYKQNYIPINKNIGMNKYGMNNMNNKKGLNQMNMQNQNIIHNDELNANTDALNAMLKNNQMNNNMNLLMNNMNMQVKNMNNKKGMNQMNMQNQNIIHNDDLKANTDALNAMLKNNQMNNKNLLMNNK